MNSSTLPFLHDWYGDFAPQLTAIIPDGPILEQRNRTWDGTAQFIIKHDGLRNLYFSANAVRTDKIGKATKADITHALACHVDVDPKDPVGGEYPPGFLQAEQQRILALLQAFQPKPTVLIFSGGGYQAL